MADRFFPGEELIYGRLRDQGTAGRRLAGAKPKSAKQKFLDSMLMKNIDPKVAARKAAYLLKARARAIRRSLSARPRRDLSPACAASGSPSDILTHRCD